MELPGQISMVEAQETEEYKAFVDKFKPKKTTDDCYTPDIVYDAVADWVAKEYGVCKSSFVRPFWPGADYERFNYPAGCVVVDNPPFSISAKIIRFYLAHNIRFFLFCNYLTCFGLINAGDVCVIPAESDITYQNGAKVKTAFVTNLDVARVRTAPTLHDAVKVANARNLERTRKKVPSYTYPSHVMTATDMGYIARHGVDFRVLAKDCTFIRRLDSQVGSGKAIYGGGLLLSERAAAERAAPTGWALSEREMEIVRSLG